MRVDTTYYARLSKLDSANRVFISISVTQPLNTGCVEYNALAPHRTVLEAYKNDALGADEFTELYLQRLDAITNPKQVYRDLIKLADGKIPTLVCWEKHDNFCHRHLVIEWLRNEFKDLESSNV